jgi:SAM-dependent methyltransferase
MDRNDWEKRYRTGDYTPREYPSDLLADVVEWAPTGRALEVATGAGRNALFLAERGYDVDAIDISETALSVASDRAEERGVEVNWICAEGEEYEFEEGAYDLATVHFYHSPALIQQFASALAPGGLLVYEHHVQTREDVERGPSDRHRFRTNDLLRYCLGLTVLEYREGVRTFDSGERAGTKAAVCSIVARKSHGGKQHHPPE